MSELKSLQSFLTSKVGGAIITVITSTPTSTPSSITYSDTDLGITFNYPSTLTVTKAPTQTPYPTYQLI